MTGATHYIEQWKGSNGVYHWTRPQPIKYIKLGLKVSKENGWKTIAIFKIKLK